MFDLPLTQWKTISIKELVLHTVVLCLCSCLSYQACKAQAPYLIAISCLSGCTIFFHIISQSYNFRKKSSEHKICVLFSLIFLSGTFLVLKRIKRDVNTDVLRSSCKVHLLMNLEFSRQILKKPFKYKIS
jgi:L-asparagine transporter-like permease